MASFVTTTTTQQSASNVRATWNEFTDPAGGSNSTTSASRTQAASSSSTTKTSDSSLTTNTTVTTPTTTSAEVSKGIRNVVGWLKQASIEVREAGKRAVTQIHSTTQSRISSFEIMSGQQQQPSEIDAKKSSNTNDDAVHPGELYILHYNDVYNIEANSALEPIGGAARFCTAIKSFAHLNPLILFSGDVFSPSMLSTYTKGEQMVPVLNSVGTHCAVFGNHDFDHGLEVLCEHVKKTNFPWLMSNVMDNETGRPLGGGKISHYVLHNGIRVGLIGLVEKEWLDTISTIDPKEVTFIDYVKAGNQLADELLNEGCEVIIALTHMRTPNDINLAKHCPKIDLILGGHDHVYEDHVINGTHILKSGTDFRQFSRILIDAKQRDAAAKLPVTIQQVDVTSDFAEDPDLAVILDAYSATIESKMTEVLGQFSVELDGRFSEIRTAETNLGDWVCDVLLSATNADVVIINSGTFRSDQIHPAGPFTMKDLVSIVPMRDLLTVLEVEGHVILAALENSVAMYPKLEGRFPQVSGISFVFDPSRPAGERVEPRLVQVADEWINLDQKYSVCIKSYMHGGCDGYTMFKGAKVLMDDDSCPEIGLALQNHFQAINVRTGKAKHSKHRQSLVTLSRRHSMVQMLDNLDIDGPSPVRRRTSMTSPVKTDLPLNKTKLCRRASLDDLEQVSCQLAPTVQHRIIAAQSREHIQELIRKRETLDNTTIIAEVDENNT